MINKLERKIIVISYRLIEENKLYVSVYLYIVQMKIILDILTSI